MTETVEKVMVNNPALASTLNVKAGTTVAVPCRNGVPVNREWRNRFRDAALDGCITIIRDRPTTSRRAAQTEADE